MARVALLLFGSGLCALIYQVAWLRELRLVFGASTAASAAVLAVFMGGLGLGGLKLGRAADRHRRPLQLYGNLELGIALTAAATPLLTTLARWVYSARGGTVAMGLGGGTVVRLVLAAVVLCVPTYLMGGTLPAAAHAVETEGDVGRRRLAVLYGANTIGAVAGTLLSTFFLLEILGGRRMLWSACALNALVAMAARMWARRLPERVQKEPAPAPAAVAAAEGRPPARLVLLAAAVVGFAFLLMELVWYRMLGPLLGGSSYTFGLILAVALAGIGLGGVAYALFGGKRTPTLTAFAITCGVEALLIALPYALGDRVALWAALIRPLGSVGFLGQVSGWAAITTIVVFPAAFVSGVQFPLLIALLGKGDEQIGRQVGLAYAWNTLGAILGSLAGGFGLMPLLSAPGSWRLVVILLAGLGLGAVAVARLRGVSFERALGPVVAAALALACLGAIGPTAAWRHGAIGAGRGPFGGTPNYLQDWSGGLRRNITWEAEGVESSVAIDSTVGHAFVVNGKIDGNVRGDAPTQVMSGMIGAYLHPHVKKAMVIGLGTGETAGWLGVVPSVERVDVAELEPAIRHMAEVCAPFNHDVMKNPKVKLFLGDAREMLLTTREKYDLIFSEPSNPYRAGIASLFTQDFYRAVRPKLEDGGLFLQWVQGYSVDAQTVRTVYATVASVFPHVETWVTEEADMILVASERPIAYDVAQLRRRLGEEPFKSAAAWVWRVHDLEGMLAHFAARGSLARSIAMLEGEDVSTDDLTLVEYGFARSAGRRDAGGQIYDDIREVARKRREDRPEQIVNGEIDWRLVELRKLSMLASQGHAPDKLAAKMDPAARARGEALAAWLKADFAGALRAWRMQPGEPEDLTELVAVGESLAQAGEEAALAYAERLRPVVPVEADGVVARLRLRQGRVEEATAALERAFLGLRSDGWALPIVVNHLLNLAPEVGLRDKAAGRRLFRALAEPFVALLADEARRNARVMLSLQVDFEKLCVEALAPYEPHVVWGRDFLVGRLRCYEMTKHPLVERARRDLERFMAREAPQFATGLIQGPPLASQAPPAPPQ